MSRPSPIRIRYTSSADRWRTLLFSNSFRMRSRGPVALRPLVFRSWTLVTGRFGGKCGFRYDIAFCPVERFVPRSLLLVLPLIAACGPFSPYRMEIQQGNYVTQEMVAQLKPGLTRDQVRFLMGTPLVNDIFHDERWDYIFVRQRANSPDVEQRRIAVFFEDGKLTRVDGDIVASAAGKPEQ